ncbi:MAG: GntR family transcriptional regulator [Clostridium sp.]|nr:GntR family transcriptional regulator [Clostridium sp.]
MTDEKTLSGAFFGEKAKTLTYKEQAYKLIKEAILYHKLEINRIYSQEAICEQLGISRTPVREALLELQNEGFIHFCRGKGIKVVELDDKSIYEILEMRYYQEAIAARLAARRATEEDLKRIKEALDENKGDMNSKDIIHCYQLDHQFHRAVVMASHNSLLNKSLDEVLNHYLRFEVLTVYQSSASAEKIIEEHNAIYQSILNHDEDAAEKAAKKHLNDAYHRTLSRYWDHQKG